MATAKLSFWELKCGESRSAPFSAEFEFDDDCECCRYRQLKHVSKKSMVFLDAAGKETECFAQNDTWSFPGLRDDGYGDRDKPGQAGDQYLPDQATGCKYEMSDTPGMATRVNVDKCFQLNPGLKKKAVSFKFKIEIVFFLQIEDTCADAYKEKEVWSRKLDKKCESASNPLK